MKSDMQSSRRLVLVNVFSLFAVVLSSCAGAHSEPKPAGAPGKTGRIDPALLDLYIEYREFLDRSSQNEEFKTHQLKVTIIEDRVLVDAIAANNVETLRQDLINLGAVNAYTALRTVSCQIPILAVPELQELQSLKFARLAIAITRTTKP